MDRIQVPRGLIQDQTLGDKRVLVFAAILFSGWRGGGIDTLVTYAGYCTDRHVGKARSVVSDLVRIIEESGFLTDDTHGNGYGVVERAEFDAIVRARGNGVNHAHLLLLLAHIRLNMIKVHGFPEYYSDLLKRISVKTGLSARSVSKGITALERIGIIHGEELPRYKDGLGNWHSNTRVFVNMRRPYNRVCAYDWMDEVRKARMIVLGSQTG